MSAPSLGLVFRPQLPPERLQSVARAADAAGLDELWLWEDCFREGGIATAAAALAWTERIRVGIGLVPVPLRNVALAAMEAATLARLFPGRLEFGVGHGVLDWMGQVGVRAASPMTLLREYTIALRDLLGGARVSTDGRYVHLDDVGLDWPPAQPPHVVIGAVGPRTIALSAEVSDGTLLTGGTTPDALRRARALVDETRAEAGITRPHTVTVYLIAVSGAQPEQRLAAELREWSLDPAEDVGIAGGPEQLADGIRRWVAAGADSVVLQPTSDEPDVEGFAELIGREVRPLLAG